ncbi:MAG TPA: MmgE/PrpD family protein [Actinomycetota bacterium]|nr:MmgE/PrpD family protein [Actinomycetota bacterium]
MTTVERLATWATELELGQIPAEVLELCRAQKRSVLGAIAASTDDAATKRVMSAIEKNAPPGPAPLFGTDQGTDTASAVYAATVASVALDFDDYMCFGHTGHTSVLVPLMLSAQQKTSGAEQLIAQVAANEIEARLGGACLIGPLNGQMWSFIHSAGAAIAAGRILGLDAGRMAHALALSLYQTNRPTVPGFMAPDSKLLTIAEPAVLGMWCATLAENGVTGPLDVLDHPQGFLSAFSYAPIRGLFGGLGRGWATKTLCVKDYPGCAYIDTTVDALLQLELPDPERVKSIDVHAGLLTCGMDRLSEKYRTDVPTPVNVNFSIPWNVAIVLLAKRLTPDEVNTDWLQRNAEGLRKVAARVRLHHDWDASLLGLKRMSNVLSPGAIQTELGRVQLLSGLRKARADHPGMPVGLRDLTRLRTIAGRSNGTPKDHWAPESLDDFQMTFPARVEISLEDRTRLTSHAEIPRGGAGHPTRWADQVATDKLMRWGPKLWPDVSLIDKAISEDADELHNALRR